MFNRFLVALCALAITLGAALAQAPNQQAQQKKPKVEPLPHQQRFDPVTGARILPPPVYQNETAEQRATRLGTSEDPGSDPDPSRKWIRFGATYTIQKFPRQFAAYDQVRYGWVRPDFRVNYPTEIYQENDEYVWVWMPDVTTAEVLEKIKRNQEEKEFAAVTAPLPRDEAEEKRRTEGIKFVEQVRKEFAVIEPPEADVTVRFRESSEGLPQTGSWRNALDVADMNGDGKLDLIVPPARGGAGMVSPSIFLGDGKGGWKLWETVEWPVGFNYGTAAVGDLNRDGHQDIAFAVHLYGVVVFLGDGKGKFTNSSEGLPTNFPTRRLKLVDLDRDGDLDIVTISEGAVMSNQPAALPFLRAYLNENRAKNWKAAPIVDDARREIAGDWLTVGDFNGDSYPDVAGASIIFNGTDLIYLSDGKMKWTPFGRGWLPFYSYYGALTAGKFSSSKRDDLVMTYTRFWPGRTDPNVVPPPPFDRIVGIDWISFSGKEPTRTPIARWQGEKPIWGLSAGDFNADRKQDIIYWNSASRTIEILLGDGKGQFAKAEVEGLEIPENLLYDVKVADVNADKRPDVILMFEGGEGGARHGSIRAWLSQPPVSRQAAAKAVAKGSR